MTQDGEEGITPLLTLSFGRGSHFCCGIGGGRHKKGGSGGSGQYTVKTLGIECSYSILRVVQYCGG